MTAKELNMTFCDRLRPGLGSQILSMSGYLSLAFLFSACSSMPKGLPKTYNSLGAEVGDKASLGQNMFVDEFPPTSGNDIINVAYNDVFKVGDSADVKVYNVENLTALYVVDRAGNIVFPLIGTVKVAGTNTMELQETLTRLYGEKYLQTPGISVKLEALDIELGKIVVDGAVNKPGVFELENIIRLSEAIALSEGLTADASRSKIYIVRTINGQRRVRIIDLDKVRQLGAEDPEIIPGDIIFVNESRNRVIFREFLRTVPIINSVLIYGTRR